MMPYINLFLSILAILVAIFMPRIQAAFMRVRLKISIKNECGLTYDVDGTLKHVRHIAVSSDSNIPAENVSVYLEWVAVKGRDGCWVTVFNESRLPLMWQYEGKGGRRIGPYQYCNVVRIIKGGDLHLVPQQVTSSLRKAKLTGSGQMRLGIQAVGDNGDSPEMTIQIDYDGTWPETDEQWEDALTVSQPIRSANWCD